MIAAIFRKRFRGHSSFPVSIHARQSTITHLSVALYNYLKPCKLTGMRFDVQERCNWAAISI